MREHDRDMQRAWYGAALQAAASVGKLPPLRRLLIQKPAIRPQTLPEQRAVMEILSAQMGIPLKKAAKTKKGRAHGDR